MNEHQRALRDFQDNSDDLSRARYANFDNALRRFVSSLTEGTPLGQVVAQLPAVDFDSWYHVQLESVGGMVGSGRLDWPVERTERVALQLEMIRRIANGTVDFHEVVTAFTYVRNNFDDNVGEFVEQVVRPFVRDFLTIAHETPAFSAGLHPGQRTSGPSAAAQSIAPRTWVDRTASWIEGESERRGKLWAVLGAIITIILAILAL